MIRLVTLQTMKLSLLEPEFVRHTENGFQEVATLAEAQGLCFLCPKCWKANGGPVGTHHVLLWSRSRGAPESATPAPARWRMDGAGIEDLTLNAEQPDGARSVWLQTGCGWHGFITDGEASL